MINRLTTELAKLAADIAIPFLLLTGLAWSLWYKFKVAACLDSIGKMAFTANAARLYAENDRKLSVDHIKQSYATAQIAQQRARELRNQIKGQPRKPGTPPAFLRE